MEKERGIKITNVKDKEPKNIVLVNIISSDISDGMKVIDEDGIKGEVKQCYDIHNVFVVYNKGGSGFYCLDENCKDYDKLYYL